MRSALRLLIPLLLVLAAIAWGAAEVSSRSARAWAEKDLGARARLVLAGVHEPLARRLGAGEKGRARDLLEELARDERLLAAALCDAAFLPFAATAAMPEGLGCRRWGGGLAEPDGREETREVPGGAVHISVLPIVEGSDQGWLVLVHDLSWVGRRAETTRQALFLSFGLVGVAAAVVTMLVARFTRRSWTEELRRLLPAMLGGGPGPAPQPAREFKPVLADVRDLVTRLAAEEVAGSGGRWSAERLRHVLRINLQGEGVLVVANREPCIHQRQPDGAVRALFPASGLVTAIEPVMRACSGTWIAHGSGSADRETADRHGRLLVPPGEGAAYTLRRVWLTEEQERGYYYGFSNEGLWPLCHLAHARPEWRVADWEQYERVNRIFAEAVVEEAEVPDPIVLVQDYHFALLPQMLRERLPRATILSFWHVPWPNAERFGICPWERRLLQGLLGSSILGFHTQAHCNNFLESVDRYLEARIDRERNAVVMGGRETLVRPYPISVDWPSRWMAAVPPVAECRAALRQELGLAPDARVGLGVDRLDYTKGIAERFLAVERLLERYPEQVGRLTFVQLAAPSRTLIPRYRELNDEVERIAARVNERFGEGSYRPIVLHRSHHEPPEVFRAYRAADFCYVSSLHDGMNLVAKEFVSARDDLAGVLVLSRFTGAARELTEALVVNPYDLEAASAAMAAALAMPRAEQQERMRALRNLVAEFNVYRWAGRMLLDATRLRQRDRLSARLGAEPGAEEGTRP